MRALSPNRCFLRRTPGSPAFLPNSLFSNILHVTPLDSRFCPDARGCRGNKPFRINILENRSKKSAETDVKNCPQFEPNSLFRRILPVSLYGSRFCRPICLSLPGKSFEMNILAISKKKIVRASTQLRPISAQTPAANSLFRKILRVSPVGSRFCRASSLSASCKLFIMNILKETPKKIASDRSSSGTSLVDLSNPGNHPRTCRDPRPETP